MSVTTAPTPWPAPAPNAPILRFGREVQLPGVPSPRRAWRWVLRRNCSITPGQLIAVYLSLCAVSLGIGLWFLLQGAPYVLGFAGLELLLVGLALVAFARHAGDCETLTLSGRDLRVEHQVGRRVERADFRAEWLSVEPAAGQGSLVELSGQGRSMRVGRYLRPELRAPLAQELRSALRRARTEPISDPN